MRSFKFLTNNNSSPQRLRWVSGHMRGLNFRLYTHHTSEVVGNEVNRIVAPFFFELNNETNRQRILTLLRCRFHRAELIQYENI